MFTTNKEKDDIVISCSCGCEDGMRFHLYNYDDDKSVGISLLMGKFSFEQYNGFDLFKKKIKKIFAIIRNKDYYYADILLEGNEWDEFVSTINNMNEKLKEGDKIEK